MATQQTPTESQTNKSSELELKADLDRHLDQLTKDVLPSSPYLLRMPYQRDNPQAKPSSQGYWSQGTLFSPDEEALQYTTFHQSPAGCLRSVGQWDDGKGGIAPQEKAQSQSSSGRTPIQNQGAKKKMTLAEYKNRDKSCTTSKDDTIVAKDDVAGGALGAQTTAPPIQVNGVTKEVAQKVEADSEPTNAQTSVMSSQDNVATKR